MSASERFNELMKYLRALMPSIPSLDKLVTQAEIKEEGGKKLVIKRFMKEVGFIKWIPPAIAFRANYPFTLLPKVRFERELNFFRTGWKEFRTPEIIEANTKDLIIVREYVEGKFLDYLNHLRHLAVALAEIHSSDRALGDVKPTNFIVSGNDLYIIDAEQSITTGKLHHKAWDLMLTAFFMAYSYFLDPVKYKETIKAFIKTYMDSGGNKEVVNQVGSFRFGGLAMLMPLPHLFTLAEVIDSLLVH